MLNFELLSRIRRRHRICLALGAQEFRALVRGRLAIPV